MSIGESLRRVVELITSPRKMIVEHHHYYHEDESEDFMSNTVVDIAIDAYTQLFEQLKDRAPTDEEIEAQRLFTTFAYENVTENMEAYKFIVAQFMPDDLAGHPQIARMILEVITAAIDGRAAMLQLVINHDKNDEEDSV